MKKISLVLAAATWVLVPSLSFAQEDKAAAYAARAVQFVQSGQYGEAERYYNAAIKAAPAQFEAYLGRAEFYDATGKRDKALADFNKAVVLSSNNSEAVLRRAAFLNRSKEYVKALADVNRVLGSESDNIEALDLRAGIELAMNQPAKCIADCQKINGINPRVAHVYAMRALAYEKLNKLDKAKADFDTAIGLDQKNEQNFSLRFEFDKRNNMDEAAIEDLGRMISLYPDSMAKVKLYRERLRLYEKTKVDDSEKVRNDLGKIIALDANDADDRYKYALISWRDDPKVSLKYISEAIALKPEEIKYYGLRGMINGDLGNSAAAIADVTKALPVDPNNADLYVARANALLTTYKYDEAIADAEKALQLAPGTAAAFYVEGLAYEGLSKPKEAVGFYNKYVDVQSKLAKRNNEEARRLEQAKRKIEIIQERSASSDAATSPADSKSKD
jgi:tetratricopeptide (TPR) repeat protein